MENLEWTQWNTPCKLLCCKRKGCPRSSTLPNPAEDLDFNQNPDINFMVDASCRYCFTKFTVCRCCPRALSQITSYVSMTKHCRNFHLDWLESSGLVTTRSKRKRITPSPADSPSRHTRSSPTRQFRPSALVNSPIPIPHPDPPSDGGLFDDTMQDHVSESSVQETSLPIHQLEDLGTGCRHNSAAYFFHES